MKKETKLTLTVSLMPCDVLMADDLAKFVINQQFPGKTKLTVEEVIEVVEHISDITGDQLAVDVTTAHNFVIITVATTDGAQFFEARFRIHIQNPILKSSKV